MKRTRLIIVGLLALTSGGCSTPVTAPTTSAPGPETTLTTPSITAAPPSSITFRSPLYGYSITLPVGWSARAAVQKWDGKAAPPSDQPEVDEFVSGTSSGSFAFAGPVTLDLAGFVKDRIGANAREHSDTCPPTPSVNEPISIGGQPGVLLGWNCGILINLAVTVHVGSAYVFGFRDTAVQDAANPADRDLFGRLLDSVAFPK